MGKEDYKNEKKGHGFLCVPKELLFDNRYKTINNRGDITICLYAGPFKIIHRKWMER